MRSSAQTRAQLAPVGLKKEAPPSPQILLAQDREIGQLMAHFAAQAPTGTLLQELEVLVRTAIFKPANALVGYLLQAAADRIDAAYQAELHLAQTGGMAISARQFQRVVQRVGQAAQAWPERAVQPDPCAPCDAAVFYVSGDGSGAPMRKAELAGRPGKQADGQGQDPPSRSGLRLHPAPAR